MKPRNLTHQLVSLLEKHHLLSANQLLEQLEQHAQPYNKTSVYRALDRLLSEGKICQYVFDGKEAVYEVRAHHHDHAICEQCGIVSSVECHSASLAPSNFKVDHHHTFLYGVCANCQAATSVS